MKNKIVKSGTVVLIVVCLLSFSCFSASALTVGGGASVEGYEGYMLGGGWDTELMSIIELYENRIDFKFRINSEGTTTTLFRCVTQFIFKPTISSYGKLRLTTSLLANNGFVSSSSSSYDTIGLYDVATGKLLARPQFNGDEIIFEYTGDIPSKFYVNAYYYYQPSEVGWQGTVATYNISFDAIDKGSQDIINNQNENADKIMNGWSGGSSVDNSTAGDFEQAESNALGGKSDAEIQSEVNNALDFDMGSLDWGSSRKLNVFMDGCLTAFGSKYMTLLLLALTLGLSAFLIGRRYG